MLPISRKTLATCLRLMFMSLSVSLMIVVLRKNRDEKALKREQTLQIDVAFVIHGSKNITSPPRKKTYTDALDWAKKITKAFGEIGVNKTRVGLILYAEKAKLMFNFTEKLTKGDVIGGIEKASSPPALGNKTFTGKALKLTLKTLLKETRKEAVKKLFVFTDRPPDDDPISPAEAIKDKEVEVYGLGGSTPISRWYTHDFSLDSMYSMLKEGPYKGGLRKPQNNNSKTDMLQHLGNVNSGSSQTLVKNQDDLQNSQNPILNPGNPVNSPENSTSYPENSASYPESQASNPESQASNPESQASNPESQTSNPESQASNPESQASYPESQASNPESQASNPESQASNPGNLLTKSERHILDPLNPSSNSGNLTSNTGNLLNPENKVEKPSETFDSTNSKPTHEISGLISNEKKERNENFAKIKYGDDASVVITETNMKNSKSLGRYSTTTDVTPSSTEFGTVIGGVSVNGKSKFDVIKPSNNSENSNIRSKLMTRMINKRRDKLPQIN